jgi:HAE1 family hydrophobic/amphiphilic exporter-1
MPLVVAAGAGAASRQAIGTAVVGGMVAATIMSLLFTPVFYVVMQKLAGFRKKKPETGQEVKKGTVKQVPAK